MPIEGIRQSGKALGLLLRMQEVTANNAANALTPGFKAFRVAGWTDEETGHPTPAVRPDLRQGLLQETGRPLDVGLEGPGFLEVQTARGVRLMRGGSLRLDEAGRLVDGRGNPLLGHQGPVFVNGDALEIGSDGTVAVDGEIAGRLRVVAVSDPTGLGVEGEGLFAPNGPVDDEQEASTRVRQGTIEEPNMDPIASMVDLITIQRAYAANIDAMKALDGVLDTVVNQVGDVR